MEFAPPPHNRLILPATQGCGPIELARCTGSDDHGPLRRRIMHGPHDSAATTQAAGHRIKSFEPPKDSAAARAQTVWARHQTSLPTSMTRWRRNRLHISQADCPCRKRQRRRGTLAINGPRPTGSPPRMTMTARPLHRVVLGRVDQAVGLPPRDGPILPPLGGCRPQALARYPSRESSGDVQRWNRVECDRRDRDASSGWTSHQSP